MASFLPYPLRLPLHLTLQTSSPDRTESILRPSGQHHCILHSISRNRTACDPESHLQPGSVISVRTDYVRVQHSFFTHASSAPFRAILGAPEGYIQSAEMTVLDSPSQNVLADRGYVRSVRLLRKPHGHEEGEYWKEAAKLIGKIM